MRNIVPLILSVAGIIIMIAATLDYVFNFNDFDTYIFIAGLILLIVGYVLTLKAFKEAPEPEESEPVRKSRRRAG